MSRYQKIFDFFKKYQEKIALTLGFILVAAISFAAGRLTLTLKSEPIEIEDKATKSLENKNVEKAELVDYLPETKLEGAYVGDINSNKYYPVGSKEAKKISDENKIWFDSKEDAEEQGYVLGASENNLQTSTDNLKESISDKDVTNENASFPGKYVGSKNSNKYHLPDSAAAKRIKEENKIWFNSREEAEAAGYEPGASIKEEDEEN